MDETEEVCGSALPGPSAGQSVDLLQIFLRADDLGNV